MLDHQRLAAAIKASGISGCTDAASALNIFWNEVCTFVTKYLKITYKWTGTNPNSGVTDPVTTVTCKVIAMGGLHPCGLTDPTAANAAICAQMNAEALKFKVIVDAKKSPGFILTPGNIIPSIVLTPSKKTDPGDAMEYVCKRILKGLKKATPSLAGTHTAFVGTATFMKASYSLV